MSKCNRCDNTGKAGEDYCACAEGRMKKTLDRAKRSAERKQATEKRKKEAIKKEKKKQMELFEEKQKKEEKEGIVIQAPCKVFDWVQVSRGQYKGVIGVVSEIDKKDREVLFEAIKHKNGHGVRGKSWFDWDEVEPLPLVMDEYDLLERIDMAIDMNDKDWFLELTAKLP